MPAWLLSSPNRRLYTATCIYILTIQAFITVLFDYSPVWKLALVAAAIVYLVKHPELRARVYKRAATVAGGLFALVVTLNVLTALA